MKKLFAGLIALSTLGAVTIQAQADGMPSARGDIGPSCAAAKWGGFYGGLLLGAGNYGSQVSLEDFAGIATRNDSNNGLMIGGQIGYNVARCSTVLGVEGDLAWTNLDMTSNISLGGLIPGGPTIFTGKSEMSWFGTIRGRAGVALDNSLLYLTAGIALADIEHSGTTTLPVVAPFANAAFNNSDTRWGWVAGGGFEHMLTDRISLKTEALYTKFEDKAFSYSLAPLTAPLGASSALALKAHDDLWTIRVGLNFKVGGDRSFEAAPMK